MACYRDTTTDKHILYARAVDEYAQLYELITTKAATYVSPSSFVGDVSDLVEYLGQDVAVSLSLLLLLLLL